MLAENQQSSKKGPSSTRSGSMRRIVGFLKQRPDLVRYYSRARLIRRVIRKSHNYDLTSRCNLFCEGCFYFDGDDYKAAKEDMNLGRWERFFHEQAASGVTFGFFAGAEPALVQERLVAAAEHITRGSINTNGTIRIRADIPYSIQVSVWGDENTTREFRGGNVFWKSIRNFSGDSRARFVFTVNPHNLDQVPNVVRVMEDNGLRIMFNYFSPTESYLEKLAEGAGNDNAFFRISSPERNLRFDSNSLLRARAVINEMIIKHPNTVIHSRAYNDALTAPGGLYDVDHDTRVARNCNGRNFKWHQSYRVDRKPSDAKCCTPNVSCSECRLYSPSLVSFVFQPERFLACIDGFCDWLDICDQFARVFLLDGDLEWTPSSDALSWREL